MMSTERPSNFRPDIEGLRALAVGSVLVYHASSSVLPAGFIGVDMFFVISGFLISGMLVREAETHGRIDLTTFYARRAKRLLPIAAVVLAATALLSRLFLSVVDWRSFGLDIASASLYVVNWRFAQNSVDYLAADTGVSPVQHYWSLAVEEQFYIVWPLLIAAAVFVAARLKLPVRPCLGATLMLVVVPSFVWALVLAERQDASAFFVTTTRLWEMGVGGLLAIAAPMLSKASQRWATPLGLAGCGSLLWAVIASGAESAWPSWSTLFPVIGTAAVLAAGTICSTTPLARALGNPVCIWIGALSYSLYLWHWPLLVIARDGLGWTGAASGFAVVAFSFLPAWVGYQLVENPFRFSEQIAKSRPLALTTGAAFSLAGLVAGLALVVQVPEQAAVPAAAASVVNNGFGAAALGVDPEQSPAAQPRDSYASIVPPLLVAARDVPSSAERGCTVRTNDSVPADCDFGDPEGDITVVVAGDSKSSQWFDALDTIGADRGWHMRLHSKNGCAFSDAVPVRDGATWQTCAEWNQAVVDELAANTPDFMIVSQGAITGVLAENAATNEATRDQAVEGLVRRWNTIVDLGITLIVLEDNPRQPSGVLVYECLLENPDAALACSFDREGAIERSAIPIQQEAAALVPEVTVVSLTDYLCPLEQCAPVIGGVLLYGQGPHMSNTYAVSLTPVLSERLAAVIESSAQR